MPPPLVPPPPASAQSSAILSETTLRNRHNVGHAADVKQDVTEPAGTSTESSVDWEGLRKLSLQSGGFGKRRVEIWTQLLGIEPLAQSGAKRPGTPDDAKKRNVPVAEPHGDERQIKLDTDRSFVLYPVGDMSERQRRQDELYELIVELFRRRRTLSYFQGYHDIISVLYLTLPKELQLPAAEKLSLHRLRDAMGAGLEPVIGLLRVLQRVLREADPEYAALLEGATPLPYYALSNLLTLFSHDVPTLPLIQHVFDYLLARPPVASVYLAAAVLLARKDEVRRLEEEGEDGMIHSLLSSLPDLVDEDESSSSHEHAAAEDPVDDAIHSTESAVAKQAPQIILEEAQVDAERLHEKTSRSPEPGDFIPSHPAVPDSLDVPSSPVATSDPDESVFSQADDSTLVDDSSAPSEADTDVPAAHEELTLVSDESEKKSGHTHDPSMDTAGSSQTAPEGEGESEGENVSGTPPPATFDDAPAASPIEPDDSTRRPRIALSTLLASADELFARFPPMAPSVDLPSIMGPQSVMLTWSEDPARLPRDDDAERIVLQPDLIVLRPPEEREAKTEDDEKGAHDRKRRRSKLHKRRRMTMDPRLVTAGVVVLGVAAAVAYSTQMPVERQHVHLRELKKLGKLAGGALLSVGGHLWDGVVAMAG